MESPTDTQFGPYSIPVAVDAPVAPAEAPYPLVLVSHGSGSSPFLFRELAIRLARSGRVVALVEHPGNHRGDDSLADTDENLVGRPRHLRLALDAVVASMPVRAFDVAVIGQSVGAYTALAIAGGKPWSRSGAALAVESDPRIGALVLLTPAVFWYAPTGALKDVTVPILVYAGEADTMTPPWHAHLVEWSVPDRAKVTIRILPHVGHLSLLSPLPAASPWRDPPGFDRAAVHSKMGDEIAAFLAQFDG